MKPLVVAIERDRDQAARLEAIVRTRVGADLVIAASTSEALAALGDSVPDLILAPALLPARDEAAVAERLRQLGPLAAHVQTITVPRLGSGSAPRARKDGGLFKRLRRAETTVETSSECDPEVFAQQLMDYLQRAQADRAAAAAAESPASTASGREANHRTAEISIAAPALLTPVTPQLDAGLADAGALQEGPAEEPAAFDPLLDLLRPARRRDEVPFEPIEHVLGVDSLLLDEPSSLSAAPSADEHAAPLASLEPASYEQDHVVSASPAIEPDPAPLVPDVSFVEPAPMRCAAEPLVAVAAASYEQEPVVPGLPVVEPEPIVCAAEPMVAVAATSYEQEPVVPVFPAVEPEPVVCAAEPMVAVAPTSYEPEPIVPLFPAVEPESIVCAAEPMVAVAPASYEQEPAAPFFPAVPSVTLEPAPEHEAESAVAVVDDEREHGPLARSLESESTASPADATFDALGLLVEPDEEIASALAAAAAVSSSAFALDPIPAAASAAAEPVKPAEEEQRGIAAAPMPPAPEATVSPAHVDDASALTLPAIDLSDLELEFLIDDEPQETVVEPTAAVAADAEAPFVIAATDFDDLEITEFLEALVTAEPEPVKPARTPKRPAAAQRTKAQPATAKAPAAAAALRAPSKAKTEGPRATAKKRASRPANEPAPAKQPAAAARPAAPPRPQAPIQDEWGVFDPDQCGFAALVAKLDEVTDEQPASKRAGTSTRVISY